MRVPFPLSLVLLAAGCAGAPEPAAPWSAEVALSVRQKLGGCVVGDLDPERPGEEIAAVGSDGQVHLVWREGDGWGHAVLGRTPGEAIQCAVGDVDPERAGNELVLVGMSSGGEDDGGAGAAYVVGRGPDGWEIERIFEDEALIHGVCVADLDPDRPGDEVLTVGYSNRAHLVSRREGGWSAEVVAETGGAGKNAVPFRDGAAVVCTDGTTLWIHRAEGGWSAQLLDRVEAGQSRIGSDGERLLVAGDDGVLGLLEAGTRSEVHREEGKLRGAVIGDLDPERAGFECATAGYSGRVVVLVREAGGWVASVVATDDDRFHHLAAGDVDPSVPGPELVACGYSGRLIVLRREPR